MTPFQLRQLELMRQMEASLASGHTSTTIVPYQSDYTNDPQLCLSANAFIPSDIAKIISERCINPLKAIDPSQYYYPDQALHITFHSIRVIHNPPTFTQSDIEASQTLLERIIPLEWPFPFILRGVLSMPTSASVVALITPEYDAFIRRIRKTFTDTGIPDDKKYFTDEMVFANSTFCRYTHTPSEKFLEVLQSMKDLDIGTFDAHEVSLVVTNAGANPGKTTILGTYRFRQN